MSEDTHNIPVLQDRVFNDELKDIVVTKENVEKKLLRLNTTKSQGRDQMHPRV